MMTYSAIDIARKMVELSIKENFWLTNLKLQKVLYFTWIDYFKECGEHLFEDRFEAWKYGPVVPSVYYEYWQNVARLIFITKPPSEEIDPYTSDFLFRSLVKYSKNTAGDLVEMTHNENTPWKKVYVENMKKEIPFRLMENA